MSGELIITKNSGYASRKMMVTVEFHKTMSWILPKQMKLLHVEKSFDILGNRGLKCEHRGGIMSVGKIPSVGQLCIIKLLNHSNIH